MPIAIFVEPIVLLASDRYPIAVLFRPVVLLPKEREPIPTLPPLT